MLQTILPAEIFAYLLVFSRIGATMMVLPGIGETYVSPRIRLLLGLSIAAVITPVMTARLPALPSAPLALVILVSGEVLIGFFIGAIARVLMSALVAGGTILAFLSGLSNALLFNPLLSDQGALPSVFLSLLGLVMIFVTDTHHMMLMALLDGYSLFAPGAVPAFGDLADTIARVLADSFKLGLQIAMPFLMFGIVFYVGMGLLARLMAQMPIFFVALPAQIMLGLFLMMTTFPAAILLFLGFFQSNFTRLFLPE